MEYAYVLLLAAALGGGILGAVVRAWSIHTKLYSLEDRLLLLEGITQREVKVRAATERWKRPTRDEERIEAALTTLPPPQTPKNWWELPNLPRSAPR